MTAISTVPAVKQAIVTKLRDVSDVPVDYCWPGPSTKPRHIFLGRHPELDDVRIDGRQEVPTIKAGRKQSQEVFELPVTHWSFRGDLTPDAGAEVESGAFEMAEDLRTLVAEDWTLGLSPQVQRVSVVDTASTLFPFQKGWACELVVTLEVHARLT